MPNAPRSGWYRDPEGSTHRRYWSGTAWGDLDNGDVSSFSPHASDPAPPGSYPNPLGGPPRYWDGAKFIPAPPRDQATSQLAASSPHDDLEEPSTLAKDAPTTPRYGDLSTASVSPTSDTTHVETSPEEGASASSSPSSAPLLDVQEEDLPFSSASAHELPLATPLAPESFEPASVPSGASSSADVSSYPDLEDASFDVPTSTSSTPAPLSHGEPPSSSWPQPASAAPGLYPDARDPEDPSLARYWNGTSWEAPGYLPPELAALVDMDAVTTSRKEKRKVSKHPEAPKETKAPKEPKNPSDRPSWLFYVVAAGVALVLVVAGIWYFNRHSLSSSSSTTTTAVSSPKLASFCVAAQQTSLPVSLVSPPAPFDFYPASIAEAIAEINLARVASSLPSAFVAKNYASLAPSPVMAHEFSQLITLSTLRVSYLNQALKAIQRLPLNTSSAKINQAWKTPMLQWSLTGNAIYTTVVTPLRSAVALTCGASTSSNMFNGTHTAPSTHTITSGTVHG